MREKDRKEVSPSGYRPLYWGIIAYVALVPLAYLTASLAPGQKDWPLLGYTAVLHALLCGTVATCCKLVCTVVEEWIPNSRLQPYVGDIRNFIAILAIWPFCVAVFMVVWKVKQGLTKGGSNSDKSMYLDGSASSSLMTPPPFYLRWNGRNVFDKAEDSRNCQPGRLAYVHRLEACATKRNNIEPRRCSALRATIFGPSGTSRMRWRDNGIVLRYEKRCRRCALPPQFIRAE